ncbi:MAG: 3'-5' exoribonuclease, partial [Polaromonas sp.]|nr:3'-5' exoribonuclease [Polaromonas sp.]
MVDLETLGTVADAVILSIGAVKFDLDSDAIDDDGFYASISIESNQETGRRIQEDTLIWWMGQS